MAFLYGISWTYTENSCRNRRYIKTYGRDDRCRRIQWRTSDTRWGFSFYEGSWRESTCRWWKDTGRPFKPLGQCLQPTHLDSVFCPAGDWKQNGSEKHYCWWSSEACKAFRRRQGLLRHRSFEGKRDKGWQSDRQLLFALQKGLHMARRYWRGWIQAFFPFSQTSPRSVTGYHLWAHNHPLSNSLHAPDPQTSN